jgi:hypothetical protein
MRVAGIHADSFEDKPDVEVIIDTGFRGWIILPRQYMKQINHQCLVPLVPEQCPVFRRFAEATPARCLDTYNFLQIRILGDEDQFVDTFPDYVCFAETEHGVIGMEFLIANKAHLLLDGRYQRFSFSVE